MEKWDKGIQMFDEAAPVDQDAMDRLESYHRHRDLRVHLLTTPLRLHRHQALELVKDPETGAYGVPPWWPGEPEPDEVTE